MMSTSLNKTLHLFRVSRVIRSVDKWYCLSERLSALGLRYIILIEEVHRWGAETWPSLNRPRRSLGISTTRL